MNKIIIGLPAYNEENSLPKLLDKVHLLQRSLGDQLRVVVVNDGSKDQTERVLQQYASRYDYISFISHAQNKGLGQAMKTLFQYISKEYEAGDVLVTLDADNTHNPEIIPRMVEQLKREALDIVIASRFVKGGRELGLAPHRKLFSRGARLYCKLVFPISGVRDYSCGFRAYHVDYLKRIIGLYGDDFITSNGFECMVEILAKSSKVGVKAGEYPLVLEYNLKEGASKMNAARTILGYFRLGLTVGKPKNH